MGNWRRKINYRKFKNGDGSMMYVITVDGKDVEVTAAVFEAYSKTDRRERYCAVRDSGRLLSLDWLDMDEVSLIHQASLQEPSVESMVMDRFLAEQVRKAFMALSEDERNLLLALIVQGVTESEYAEAIGVKQQSVWRRKKKILEKLKKAAVKRSDFWQV